MPVIPGGQIIGGMGGRIYLGPMGWDRTQFLKKNANTQITLNQLSAGGCIEVDQWAIARTWINAECTHGGTYGAITRRLVAYDWQFQCSLPADQANLPDYLLNFQLSVAGTNPNLVNVAIAFFLGDVTINPEAVAMGMTQKFYYAPACIIRAAQPVLNAARDVIRYQVSGEGNSRLWLLPDENTDCDAYFTYLKNRGWLV